MKKILCLLCALLLIFVLAACGETTITMTTVNDNLHFIVWYSDGSTEDLGYVGVDVPSTDSITVTDKYVDDNGHLIITYSNGKTEDLGDVTVTPPLYTVRFLDKDGNVLKTEKVYKGMDATAPDAPKVTDMVFSRWDAVYTNIQSNIDIRPVYTGLATFTVTFKDDSGNVLKTETVKSGKSATAPTAPTKTDYVFDKWDKSFSNVTSNLTVTAVYRAKGSYTVTFKDYTGVTLGSATVKEGETATAPATPVRDGYTFSGWSASLMNITSNKTVTAQYKIKNGSNIFDLSYAVSGNTLTLTATMKGSVLFAAMEGQITIPSGLTYKSVTAGDDKTIVYKDGNTFYFITTNTTNIKTETVIFKATFTIGSEESYIFDTVITDICDQDTTDVGFSVIGKTVKVK